MIKRIWPAGVTAAVLVVAPLTAAAQEPGTAAQKKACRPDVYRLCAAEIPNVKSIVRCLKGNMSRLSPDCRAVMESGAS
jgi:hypothetical protein